MGYCSEYIIFLCYVCCLQCVSLPIALKSRKTQFVFPRNAFVEFVCVFDSTFAFLYFNLFCFVFV